MSEKNTAARSAVDWEAVDPHWRAGILSKKELSAKFGVSRTAIDKHFAKLGVERDLSAQIQHKAESLVARQEVAQQVAPFEAGSRRATDKEIIDGNAQKVADVQLSHRKDIRRNRNLANKLLEALEAQVDDPELFRQLGELMYSPDDKGQDKLNDLYRKVIALPQQIDGAKKLAETLKVLVGMEREAFGMKSDSQLEEGGAPSGITVQFVRAGV